MTDMKTRTYAKCLLLILMLCMLAGCAGSRHRHARRYENGKCIVYHPDNERIQDYARSLCAGKEEAVHDYTEKKSGDFVVISYEDGKSFYLTRDYKEPQLEIIDKEIVADQLRYGMKKDGIDLAYTSAFMLETAADQLSFDNYSVSAEDGHLLVYVPEYDYTVRIPLCYASAVTGKDFGIMTQTYMKHRYIDPKRPMVALTFDDGPYSVVDSKLYDLMEAYDARCTFFFVGNRLDETEIANTRRGIALGLEYGSHSMGHEHLNRFSVEEAKRKITDVADEMFAQTGYRMKIYRPPYGERNREMEQIIDMTAILWNVDSLDWKNRDTETTYQNVMNAVTPNDVVLMHSLYPSTAEACQRIVPELIDAGYQLVTVSELMEYLGISDTVFGGK